MQNHHGLIVVAFLFTSLGLSVISTARASAQVAGCPTGYSCVLYSQGGNCPAGYVCTPRTNTNNQTSNAPQVYSNGFYTLGGGYGQPSNGYTAPVTTLTPSQTPTISTYNPNTVSACYVFNANLSVGSSGVSVTALQQRLGSLGIYYGPVTGYYGSLTQSAVSKYQSLYYVYGENGYLGPVTRAKLNTSCGGANTGTVTPPSSTTALSASCYGYASGTTAAVISWGAQVSGGRAPYNYSWSAYGDPSTFPSGSMTSQNVSIGYKSTGAKQAAVRIVDSAGASVSATCSGATNSQVVSASPQPIVGRLTIPTTCVRPGTNVTATSVVTGDGITSKILEKDTNRDGVYGQVASWGSGSGTNTYTTAESSSYTGWIDLRLIVNGVARDIARLQVSNTCGL